MAMSSATRSSSACRPRRAAASGPVGVPRLPPPPAPKHQHRGAVQTTRAFGADAGSLESSVNILSGALTTGALAAAVWMLSQPEGVQAVEDREDACPRCNGSGYEPCICTRWSDDDQGCASCAGKLGYMMCRACGGGGRARVAYRPIKMTAGPPQGGNL